MSVYFSHYTTAFNNSRCIKKIHSMILVIYISHEKYSQQIQNGTCIMKTLGCRDQKNIKVVFVSVFGPQLFIWQVGPIEWIDLVTVLNVQNLQSNWVCGVIFMILMRRSPRSYYVTQSICESYLFGTVITLVKIGLIGLPNTTLQIISQLWSPDKIQSIKALYSVQRSRINACYIIILVTFTSCSFIE